MFKNSSQVTEEDLVAEDFILERGKQYCNNQYLLLTKDNNIISIGLANLDNIILLYNGDGHSAGSGYSDGDDYGVLVIY